MKTGSTIQALAEKITTLAKSKRDFIADTRNLMMLNDGSIEVGRVKTNLPGTPEMLRLSAEGKIFKPTRLCQDQIAGRVGIPSKYAERMMQEAPALLAFNVNHWFKSKPEKRMLRCFDNGEKTARAFLSERYRPLDNFDLANNILPKLTAAGCEIRSCELTERRLYIQASTPKLEDVIKAKLVPGTHNRVNDVVQAGIVISNSEVGCGAVNVEPMIYRLVCSNGLILPNALRKYHVGRAGNGDENGEDGNELFTERTQRLSDQAFWAQVCDVVDGSLNEIKFRKTVEDISAKADGKSVGNPVDIVEVLTNKLDLSEGEGKNVLQHLCAGGSLDMWGLANAVTRAAEDCESYDRAIELERAGAVVLEMKPEVFANN